MKPTRNKVFCQACKHTKILFDSQSKADNFIKFNSEEIIEENGKAPVRSYFCPFCSGWHVTSLSSLETGANLDSRDQRIIKKIMIDDNELSKIKDDLVELEKCVQLLDYDKAEHIIVSFNKKIIKAQHYISNKDITKIRSKLNKCRAKIDIYNRWKNMTDEEQVAILNTPSPTKEQKREINCIKELRAYKSILSVIQNRELLVRSDDDQTVQDIINICKTRLKVLNWPKEKKNDISKTLREILDEHQEYIKSLNCASGSDNSIVEEESLPNEQPCTIIGNKVEELVPDLPTAYSEDYKAELLNLINKIEAIQESYRNGDLEECKDLLNLCLLLINTMKKDKVTKYLEQQLIFWEQKL